MATGITRRFAPGNAIGMRLRQGGTGRLAGSGTVGAIFLAPSHRVEGRRITVRMESIGRSIPLRGIEFRFVPVIISAHPLKLERLTGTFSLGGNS
jgi:hypothetical protein